MPSKKSKILIMLRKKLQLLAFRRANARLMLICHFGRILSPLYAPISFKFFILFYFILFYFISNLFYLILFYFILIIYFILFNFFCFIHCISFYYIILILSYFLFFLFLFHSQSSSSYTILQVFQSSSIIIMNCGILTNRKWKY